ncbi:MAG: ABC transporter substrate-binding protein [Myxococcaceae bacterium]
MACVRPAILIATLMLLAGCPRSSEPPSSERGERTRLVFTHQPLWGDPAAFEALLDAFRREHPEVELATRLLPNDSDVAHEFFLTSLEGRAAEFDVLVVDVVWVAEFARAGWIAELSGAFPPGELRADFLAGPAEAVTLEGQVYAVPWYVDVGLLYYRSDLVPRAPRTYQEFEAFAAAAKVRDPSLQGYVWQGRQYEGLVCNAYEAIWGHGGGSQEDGRLLLDTPAAVAAVGYLRSLVARGLSPPSVTSAAEEETRRAFQSGRAVFMRNWPYAFAEAQRPDSPVRGKVEVAALPSLSGEPGPGALGGWQLAVNAWSPRPRRAAAEALIRHLTSPAAALTLALAYGRNPARSAVYRDPALIAQAPFIAGLLPRVLEARPRPVSPFYNLLSDTLQGELSAAVTGIRTPAEALRRAQARADHLTGAQR